ncbi:MAG TPA: PAC2 family protein [Dehalococcoidia bacterium]|jgi:proteasome assembly chaperone (PAC2) family protein|nr:PAC2 family protein [Dehalococcoidia bacterium]HIL30985.1 PAC2 family protein [Dehalococcoidia bacterium]
MEHLIIHETPDKKLKHMVVVFSGWADAAEGATSAIKFLQRKLKSKKFAEIDPEEFYDFSQTRPYTSRTRDGKRRIHWPANEFSYLTDPRAHSGVMVFVGVEPNLKWRTFAKTVATVAKDHGVESVVHIGALLDAVPHTRPVKLSGTASESSLSEFLEGQGIRSSNYQGPTGISSAVMAACIEEGLEYTSIWGHTSHYLQAAPNHRVGSTLLEILLKLLNLPLDLAELKSAAGVFNVEVEKAVAKDDQIASYVTKLEGQYDEAVAAIEIPDPAELVRDLEKFLRGEQRRPPTDLSS